MTILSAVLDANLHPVPLSQWRAGSDILGPRNYYRERQSPDMIRPPATDNSTMPN